MYTYTFSETMKVEVISPNGGEITFVNSDIVIKWIYTSKHSDNPIFVIILYKNGIKFFTISRGTGNNGSFIWHIPEDFQTGKDFRVRIRIKDNLSINDFSDNNFTIKKKGKDSHPSLFN